MELRLLGPIALVDGDRSLTLPRSRKTRALLGYLAAGEKAVRRERLCELLWDIPDDPRAALRWSLSKLRALLGTSIVADREAVQLDLDQLDTDFHRMKRAATGSCASLSTAELETLAATSGDFLEGLDLPHCDGFNAWRTAIAEDVRRWRCAIWRELSQRDLPAERLLPFARAWLECAPGDVEAQANLMRCLQAAGRQAGTAEALAEPATARTPAPVQDIRFCRSADGTSLAYAVTGSGPPLIKVANWHTHLEQDFDSPVWPHWIETFSAARTMLRYDERGNGMSDWDTTLSHDAFVADLEAIADASGFDRFDLLAISHGASVAIRYAVLHPERVRRMVLFGAYAAGWAVSGKPEDKVQHEMIWSLTKTGWALDNPALRTLFTATFLPEATPEQVAWFDDFQRSNASLENTLILQKLLPSIDVRRFVAEVRAPTLLGHSTRDAVVPFAEARALAAQLPGARFLAVDSANHLLLREDPGWPKFARAAVEFLTAEPTNL